MNKLLICLLATTLLLSNCTKKHHDDTHTIAYFQANLKADMTTSQLIATFGTTYVVVDGQTYIFGLSDGTSLWITYSDTSGSQIQQAEQHNQQGQVLLTLI